MQPAGLPKYLPYRDTATCRSVAVIPSKPSTLIAFAPLHLVHLPAHPSVHQSPHSKRHPCIPLETNLILFLHLLGYHAPVSRPAPTHYTHAMTWALPNQKPTAANYTPDTSPLCCSPCLLKINTPTTYTHSPACAMRFRTDASALRLVIEGGTN